MHNDSPSVQEARIRELGEKIFPKCRIEFKKHFDKSSTDIRPKVIEIESGRIISVIPKSFEWFSSQVADWTDDKLITELRRLVPTTSSLQNLNP